MGLMVNTTAKAQIEAQSGCCCRSTSDIPDTATTVAGDDVANLELNPVAQKNARDQSGGCCGGH
jgi:hypothetical protein